MSDYFRSALASKVDEKLLCPECRKILEAPMQTSCGHRYCKDCLDGICRNHGIGKCIVVDCNEEFTAKENFPDKAIQKEVMNIKLECLFKDTGCEWKGRYRDIKDHFKDCRGEQKCPDCKENVRVVDIEEHRSTTCSNKRVPCIFEQFGCKFKPTEEDKERHVEAEWFNHLVLMLPLLLDLSKMASNANTGHGNGNGKQKDLGNEGATGGAEAPANPENRASKPTQQQGNTILEKKIETIEGIMSVLHREVEKMSTKFDDDANPRKVTEDINRLREDMRIKDATIASLSLKLDELRHTSYDRTLVWKIVNCRQKMEDAKSKRVVSIFSTPFCTEKNGYKMCGRIYLNGDGMGKGTHVSLFFVICRGENDAILSWPFRQKVTFTMVSQNKKEHIVDAFRTDPSSSSFKKPVAEMNTASGCPLFASLSDVLNSETGFIKDDTMFIQIKVEGDSGMIV